MFDRTDDAPPQSPSPSLDRRGACRGDIIANRYLVEGQIGRGGMGRVLQVRHQVLGKLFALKLIKAPIAAEPRIRGMFYREARLASALSHENICSIVDFGADERFGLFMVMELLEGQNLLHRLYKKGRLAPKVACDVMWQIAEALRYIHDEGVVHGDIKSENIFLTRTPERRRVPKLLDFGLARASVHDEGGYVEGTVEYMAPEITHGQPPTVASDIYALGVLFYELLIGVVPFRGTSADVFRQHRESPLPRVAIQLQGAIDERVDEIITRATAKNPDDRYPDVASFLYELRTLMNMLGMPLPGRIRRRHSDGARNANTRRLSANQQRGKAASEVFDYAPVALAAVSRGGRVRVANSAFWRFLGMDEPIAPVDLGDSPFPEVYPEVLDDLERVGMLRTTLKKVLRVGGDSGSWVEVAVVLRAAPAQATATAGEIYLTLHPLGRLDGH